MALTFCPRLMLESKSALRHSISPFLSLSHHFIFLHFLSNPLARTLTVVILDVISQPGYQSKSLPNISLGLLVPYQIYKWCSRQKSSLHLVTYQLSHPTPFFPLSALHCDPLAPHMYCRLCGPIFHSEMKHFQPSSLE